MSKTIYDICVLGGGHAGAEAAWIASEFNLKVAIVTMPNVAIASTPCNPSIGGVGKGQVVRELDALGGLMGKMADLSAIQYRILNESKGAAVQSTRVQVDKVAYQENVLTALRGRKNLKIIELKVTKITKENVFKIVCENLSEILSKKLIVTTGTFLGGKLHCGEIQAAGGRANCENSASVSSLFQNILSSGIRFKTGTPPRIDKNSINYKILEVQPTDTGAVNFHCLSSPFLRTLPQTSCHLTRINQSGLDIIRQNRNRSPIFNGQISGVGPRYCPSIEDKAFRYPDRNTHHVFLEPESYSLNTVYPSGVSTSLPSEVQENFIRQIPGLEEAKILQYGYAVEYDVINTQMLNHSLMCKEIEGLYFAGQVNGTSGYEEAAAQGFIAGANAALSSFNQAPLLLDRNQSYIGVLIDDLVTTRRDEPYRLFTARAENRLHLRDDNAVLRMAPYRSKFGLNNEIDIFSRNFLNTQNLISKIVHSRVYKNSETESLKKRYPSELGVKNVALADLLRRPNLKPTAVLRQEAENDGVFISEQAINCAANTEKYSGYILRAGENLDRMAGLHRKKIDPEKLATCSNISFECRLRIKKFTPQTFGQLSKIEGIRPATLIYVANQEL